MSLHNTEYDSLLSRIEALEDRVAHLTNRPAQYVPPPIYGPLPEQRPEITFDLSPEDIDKIVAEMTLITSGKDNELAK